jgi:hypothetical protein
MCWQLVGAREGTFIDVEFGMEPARLPHKAFDVLAGKRFYRNWLEQSPEALRAIAEREAALGSPARPDEQGLAH